MNVQDLINEGVELFENKKFDEAIEKLNQALDGIEDKNSQIQEQNDIQYWLGRCYLEQAMKAKGKESEQLFGQAVEHFQQQLSLANQNSLQRQIYAQAWLGRCYLEYAKKAKGKESERLFREAVKHLQQRLSLANQLEDNDNSLQRQINARHWLGRCYLEQAIKAKNKKSEQLCRKAVKHFERSLEFAKQLENKQNSLQEQVYAQSWLGRCYLEQAIRSEVELADRLFETAVDCYKEQLSLSEDMEDEQNSLQARNSAQSRLGRCYFAQAKIQQKWERYFDWKKQKIQGDLFGTQEGTQKEKTVIDDITTILAVLNIPPMELGSIPLAHYTSPSVCERLFGIVSDQTNDKTPVDRSKVSPMRIGSSTYMNDPTEGEGLLELLNLQDLELENKADCPVHNAFFTCFSSRVNDLNQFRLYGKENGVEASGCCLVFNKSGDWLKEPDVSASFKSFTNKQNEGFKEPIEADVAGSKDENLPLYQVAYIAYQDEYIAEEKCGKWLLNKNNQSFGIRLKPVGKNPSWHQFRIKKLEEALIELIKKSNNISDEDRKALEYIRYLFKDFAFRDEEEFRLLKIEQIGSDKIEYCNTTQSIYLPYADVRDMVDEVILGTNYEKSGNHRKAEVFQHLMRKHYPNVKVSRSSLPINANPPIKKD
ncbi:tetratricopeptide repeat protein [Neisseria sp. P0022.S007]|uniref:tetratricopeptide repeat protein n=1 Tax=unclassified Neisseria TaxID=2623750 RepID=UPI003F816504